MLVITKLDRLAQSTFHLTQIADTLKNKGVKFGAKAKLAEAMVAQMKTERNAGVLIKDLCFKYRISKTGVYRLLAA